MPQAGFNQPNGAQIPLLVVISAVQGSLAAGAEAFLNIPAPLNYVFPTQPGQAVQGVAPCLCQVIATDVANAALVATANLNSVGGGSWQVRVRNVGTVASGTYQVLVMIFGPGGAINL